MATVYRTTGELSGSDGGHEVSLATVEARLTKYRCEFIGGHPRAVMPASAYFVHVVVAVIESDEKTAKFPKNGFYLVTNLHAEKSAFLTAPETD